MDRITIKICDFSKTPGSRYRDEGKKAHSGQEFREDILEPKFREAMERQSKILVDLDGTIGYGTSWLEEVFGGLARTFGYQKVLDMIDFKSEEEDYLIEDIKEYIKDAEKR
jgi:hypothetical protein